MIKITEEMPISFADYPDPTSWCVSLYFVGCSFGCEDCHNKGLQSKDYPTIEYNLEDFFRMLMFISKRQMTDNFCLLGGEPLNEDNLPMVKAILKYNKDNEVGFNFCIYTGYSLDWVKQIDLQGFEYIKCNLYDNTKKTELNKAFKTLGSTNQVMYNKNLEPVSVDGVIKL